MPFQTHRIAAALIVLLLWALVTVLVGAWSTQEMGTLLDVVTQGPVPAFVAAVLLLVVACAVLRWEGIGLGAVHPWRSLRILLLPSVYLVLFFSIAVALGLPPLMVIGSIVLNCLLASFSEEVMFRGILFQGLRSRLAIWPAIWVTSLLFGAIHSLNVFLTGEMAQALVQSVAAVMSGVLFIAMRLRTGSLWPPILFHAAWNASTFLLVAAAGAGSAPPPETSGLALVAPLLFVLPNLLYGLYLLRDIEYRAATGTA
ncbi:hypothetical protein C5F48_10975 [Cereibacter changlensis JA139]|uniref:CAAX prenyl protease 2/Lysostaphin resistance protein A-like domain-containing protein n=2 Tax=Cereibacter changlensis TaxID=402884 RepID=A0A2T4JVD4_9RHOB|nr:CPBP family intramembrane glutamic endopeptidase [Cereibacter changlensis]PTE21723.1 hypothetical protein C5F48_10975 [Cereibacter changlensis JA139]PZX57208.1 hypothetical protein LX76_00748 [Cereibacter changlensis]